MTEQNKRSFNFIDHDMQLGDVIITQRAGDDVIYIKRNRLYLLMWSIPFFTVPFVLGHFLFKSNGLGAHYMVYIIFFILSTPFVIVGVRFLKTGLRKSTISFNCKQAVFSPTKSINIPFSYISHFQLTYLVSAGRKARSYHIIIVFKSGQETVLVKDSSMAMVEFAAQHLSEMTGIQLNEDFLPA